MYYPSPSIKKPCPLIPVADNPEYRKLSHKGVVDVGKAQSRIISATSCEFFPMKIFTEYFRTLKTTVGMDYGAQTQTQTHHVHTLVLSPRLSKHRCGCTDDWSGRVTPSRVAQPDQSLSFLRALQKDSMRGTSGKLIGFGHDT
uniref:Uncharacterized protein n=1 Tax=Setaria digitata TaxID=48799 RepID=A0A915PSS1_9BILA